jgi:5'-methylthioadenosine phosphorylase
MKLGIIGGSGLNQIEEIKDISTQKVSTPFGDPSDDLITAPTFSP